MEKAYIVETPQDSVNNKFKVRVPSYESGNSEAIFDALLCATPGNYYGYNVGDCVYIEFEGDSDWRYSEAVILGKLYTGVPEKTTASLFIDNLKVSDTVNLPKDTRIDGKPISQTIGSGGGGGDSGSGKSYDAEIEELNKKLQFSDWVIEQSGDRLNFYRKYFTESEV